MCFGGDNLILIDTLYNVTGKNTHLRVKGLLCKGKEVFESMSFINWLIGNGASPWSDIGFVYMRRWRLP